MAKLMQGVRFECRFRKDFFTLIVKKALRRNWIVTLDLVLSNVQFVMTV